MFYFSIRITKLILFLIFLLGFSTYSIAARYWIANATSNWNNTANWSSSSGGAGGSSVPVSIDDVNFDNNGIGNCTIDAAVNIKSITISIGYTGAIVQNANAINVSSVASLGAGIFTGGSANISIGGAFTLSGTVFTSTSAILELRDNAAFTSGSFSHNNGTLRFNTNVATQTISGNSPTLYNLEFVGLSRTYAISSSGNIQVLNNLNITGTLFYNLTGGAIDAKGDINVTNSASGCGGDATITINGTGTQNFVGSTTIDRGALPKLIINKSSGTLNLSNYPAVSNDFTYTAGTVNAGTSTFCFTRGSVASFNITGNLTLNSISITSSSAGITITVGAASTLTANADLILSGTGTLLINTGNINVKGDINVTNSSSASGGDAAITINGGGTQNFIGSVTAGRGALPKLTINKISGTLNLSNYPAVSNDFTYIAGTVNGGSSTFCFIRGAAASFTITGSLTLNSIFFSSSASGLTATIAASTILTATADLSLTGTATLLINTGNINVNGDIAITNSSAGSGGDATITINGTGTQNFVGSVTAGRGALPKLTINKISGTLNLSNYPAISNDFTYIAGTVNAGSSTVCFTRGSAASFTITGNLILTNISFTANSSGVIVTVAAATTLTANGDLIIENTGNTTINTGSINVNGNVVLTNTSTGGGGSANINMVGTGNQTIDGTALTVNQCRLPTININKVSGILYLLGNISFSSNITYVTGNIDPGTSTCYIVNNLTVTGTFSVYNLSIAAAGNTTVTIASGSTLTANNRFYMENAGYININTGTIAVLGDIINSNTNTSGGGTATILINGTGAQSITSTGVIDQGRFPGVTINKISGTLTFPSLITVRGNWTYTSGTIDVTTNNATIVFENTLTITGSHTLNNVIFYGSNNFTFTTTAGTTLTVAGTMNMTGTGNIILSTGTINLNGNLVLTNTSAGGGGSSVIAFVSGTNQTISSSLLINQNCLPSVTINKTGGTLFFPALITVKGNWTYTAGTLDVITNNSTVVFATPLGTGVFGITGSHSLNNVTFQGNGNNTATVNTGTLLTVTGTLSTIGASNVFINTTIAGATAINAQGDIIINNTSTAGGGTGLILINGSGSQAFTSTAAASQGLLPHIKIQKNSGALTLTGIISESRDWTYVSGTVDASTNVSTVVFGGNNLTISSSGMSFYNVIVTSSTSTLVNSLSVNGSLTINGTGTLAAGANTINLSGNWTNRGTAGFTEATSSVNFNGTALQTITSPGGENFTNLTTNNTGSGIQLMNNITVATGLTMTQGNIDLNSNIFTLGLSAANKGTLTRTNGTMINTGSFTRWFNTTVIPDGAITGLFPMGNAANYRPFSVSTPVIASTTGGTMTVSYADAATSSAVSVVDGLFTIVVRKNLNWTLSTANGLAGGLYNLKVEGTGFGTIGSVMDLRLHLAGGIVGMAGVNGGTTINPQVNRTGLSLANLSNTFYLGSVNGTNTPLPITLTAFTATVQNEITKLEWKTSTEWNNNYFTIQRSADAVSWKDIAVIKAAGNTNMDSYYTAYDESPLPGIAYYRLKQTDNDGKYTHSYIKSIINSQLPLLNVYTNPGTNYITITSTSSEQIDVIIYNVNGQKVNLPFSNNANKIIVYTSGITHGTYLLYLSQGNYKEIKRVVINQ